MWLNIQAFEEPFRIKYNVDDSKLWRPFFEKSDKNRFESIQPESLIYKPTEPKYVKDLEAKIESKLRDKLTSWRPRHITKIHRYVSGALRQILSTMEKRSNHIDSLANQKEPEELEQYLKTYRISGFPINVPYTNMNQIFEAVYATQVHSLPTNDVEFALAVCVVPYPNTILSVWIYIASLIRKS
jgi:coiled-coil and C2 domain-containing protein 2A